MLTSCFNKFRLDAMIEACCIQYPSVAQHGGAGPHGAHVADLASESEVSSDDTDGAASGGVPQEAEHAVHVATQVYQNAKKKLREARNARGFFRNRKAGNPKPHGANVAIPDFAESQHPKVIKMKQTNPCHSCGRTGHWQYDSAFVNFAADERNSKRRAASHRTSRAPRRPSRLCTPRLIVLLPRAVRPRSASTIF